MSSKKKEVVICEQNEVKCEEPRYPAALLAKSEVIQRFGLHYDIIRAILCNSEYTLEEAKQAVSNYINSFNA